MKVTHCEKTNAIICKDKFDNPDGSKVDVE